MDEIGGASDPAWRAPRVWRALMVVARVLVACVGRLRVSGDLPAELRGTPVLMASTEELEAVVSALPTWNTKEAFVLPRKSRVTLPVSWAAAAKQ